METVPIYISKLYMFYMWLYNVNLVKYIYGVIHNIAFYCKLPVYVITILCILFSLIFLYFFIRKILRLIFKPVNIFDKQNPKTLLHQVLMEQGEKEASKINEIKELKKENKKLIEINKKLISGDKQSKEVKQESPVSVDLTAEIKKKII